MDCDGDVILLLLSGCVTLDKLLLEKQESLVGAGETLNWGEEPDTEDIYKVIYFALTHPYFTKVV